MEMLCGPFLAPSRATVPGVSSTGTQIWCPAAEAQGQPGKRQEPGASQPQGLEGREVLGRFHKEQAGPGLFPGASLSTADGAVRTKQTLLFPAYK